MKLHIRDGFWLILVVGMSFAWWNHASLLLKRIDRAQREAHSAEGNLQLIHMDIRNVNREADVMSNEVRRMRGIVKSTLADKREWFELEVKDNNLIAIYPGTSESNLLTLEKIKAIEAETGLEAKRLRQLLTPISALQLGKE